LGRFAPLQASITTTTTTTTTTATTITTITIVLRYSMSTAVLSLLLFCRCYRSAHEFVTRAPFCKTAHDRALLCSEENSDASSFVSQSLLLHN
jgi:hypothetical protein